MINSVSRVSPKVVVGVSDSACGQAALRAGVALARERGTGLELARVWRDVGRLFSMSLHEARQLSESQQRDQELLDEAITAVSFMAPDLACTGLLTRGELYEDLLERCREGDVLFLGAGDGDGSSHLIGEWFVRHAPCQVRLVQREHLGT